MPGHYGNSGGGSMMNRSSSARRTTRRRGRGTTPPRSNAMNMRSRTPRTTGAQARSARMRRGAGTRVSTPPAQMRANRVVRSRGRGAVSGRNMMNQHGGGRSSLNASATNLGKRQTGRATIYNSAPRGGRNSRTTSIGAHNSPSRQTGLE